MKRNRKMNKYYKGCLKQLDEWLGEADAGLLISVVCKCLRAIANDGTQNREIRNFEIKINDYFSAKWDFDKGGFVDE